MAMASPPDDAIVVRLRELLAHSDLQTTTEKMLRKQLEEHFGIDLTDKKPLIRQEVERYLAEQGGDEEEEQEAEDVNGEEAEPGPSSKGRSLGCILSPALQEFLGVETLARPQVVKRIWEYIRANNLQDPKDKRNILVDAKLRTIFNPPVTMFSMNSQLTKHCKTADGQPAARAAPAKRAAGGAAKAAPARKKAKAEAGDGKEKKPNGFTKPVKLSPQLAAIVGRSEMGRNELTKFFWDHFKANDMMDPADKRYVLLRGPVAELFGEARILAFGIQKHLAPHIIKD